MFLGYIFVLYSILLIFHSHSHTLILCLCCERTLVQFKYLHIYLSIYLSIWDLFVSTVIRDKYLKYF